MQQLKDLLICFGPGSQPAWMQGDFIEALMDNVGAELGKSAREISEFSLNGHLDAALRASSAHYDAADMVNRLRIKLETQQLNDKGNLCFSRKSLQSMRKNISCSKSHALSDQSAEYCAPIW